MIEIQSRTAVLEPVFVQTADDAEYQLIRTAHEALNQGNWIVGECASKWLAGYGRGRTDEQFAELIECKSRTRILQCRQVWERFGNQQSRFKHVTWTHFREAVQWEDADECLQWAEDQEATVRQMIVWRKAKRGELDPPAGRSRVNSDAKPENVTASDISEQTTEHGSTEPQGRTVFRPLPKLKAEKPSEPAPEVANEQKQATTAIWGGKLEIDESTQVVSVVLRKIDELIGFVITKGSEEERSALLDQLRPIVEQLSPEPVLDLKPGKGRKVEKIQASLAMANVIFNEWNMIDGVKPCRDINRARRQKIAERMRDPFWRDNWRAAIDKIRETPALRGKNDTNWRADFEWFIRPNTVVGVLEGKYDDWKPTSESASNLTKSGKRRFSLDDLDTEDGDEG